MNSFGQIQQHCTKVELAKGKYWQYRTHPYTAQCTPHTHTLHQGFPGDAQKRENVWTMFRPGGKALNVKGFFFTKFNMIVRWYYQRTSCLRCFEKVHLNIFGLCIGITSTDVKLALNIFFEMFRGSPPPATTYGFSPKFLFPDAKPLICYLSICLSVGLKVDY